MSGLTRNEEELLARVLDGEASPAEMEAFSARARENPELRLAFEQSQAIQECGRKLPVLEPSRDVVTLVENSVRAESLRPTVRWRLVTGISIAAACAASLLFVWSWMQTDQDLPGTLQPSPTVASARWTITILSGPTWVQQRGARRKAAVGDLLTDGDRVETGAGASVELTTADQQVGLLLEESTRVGVLGARASHLEVIFEQGALRASARAEASAGLHIQLGDSLHKVEMQRGEVGMLSNGAGTTSVACDQGTVVVRVQDEKIHLTAGHEVHGGPNAWSEPRHTMAELALNVRADPMHGNSATITGQTNPGAQVLINGEQVEVHSDGSFTHRVELIQESQELFVKARDALLRDKSTTLALRRPKPPRRPKPTLPKSPRDSDWEVGWEDEKETPG
jgi:hypothetical protein